MFNVYDYIYVLCLMFEYFIIYYAFLCMYY